ncbi:MAG: hypothetical protein NVSMB51_04850 [Solirubrobacteraceae bacterium]
MRTFARALLALLCAGLLLPAAGAAQNPFGPPVAPAPPQDQATSTQAATTSTSSGGLSSGSQVLIFVGAGAVLAAIAFVIMRDARIHAPARARTGAEPQRKTTPPLAVRVDRGRAKAKRARQARKRNR